MTGLSNYSALNLLNYITGISGMPALPASQYLALLAAVGDDSGAGLVEPPSGNGYNRVQIAGNLLTTSLTASGSAVLNITGVPAWIKVGMLVSDFTSPSSIPAGSFILSKATNSITLSNVVPGVASGDSIRATSFGIEVSGDISHPFSITNGASIPFPQATGTGYGTVPAFAIYDASGIGAGNLLTWDFFGLYDWEPFFSASGISASGAVFQQVAHGFSAGVGVIVSSEFGGTLPTVTQGVLSGYALNYAANVTPDAYTLSSSPSAPNSGNAVWASNTGNGQARRVDPINIPGGVQETIPPNSLYLSIFSTFGSQATGAATFMSPSGYTVSSLESGKMVYVAAGGGNEYGYAYRYSLANNAPAGVSIDRDTGCISITSGLALGANSFNIIANNLRNTFLQTSFPFTLNVLQGITSGTPTSGQILHKTYDPLGGLFGSPTGTVFNQVFLNINAAIQTDQFNFLEGHLRATIPLRKGMTYQYTSNHTIFDGLQYYSFQLDPAFSSSGTAPIMQNIISDPGATNPYDDGPMTYGLGDVQFAGFGVKSFSPALATMPSGSVSGTILNGASGMVIPGRWAHIVGQTQQSGGSPANLTYGDYVIVTSVSGTTVTWDRPTRYRYAQDWFEFTADDGSLGQARMLCFDVGSGQGQAQVLPSKRAGMRGLFKGINFQPNPNAIDGGGTPAGIMSVANQVMLTYENCNILNVQPTVSKNVGYYNCTIMQASEPDKQMETCYFIGCSGVASSGVLPEMGGATGVQFLYLRDCIVGGMQMSPRQWRSENTFYNATGDNFFTVPIGSSFNGPNMDWNFASGCTFASGTSAIWCFGNAPFGAIAIGTDVIKVGLQYQIQQAATEFGTWLAQMYEGMIITTDGLPPYGDTPWGYIDTIQALNNNSSPIYMNLIWVSGVAPVSGNLYVNARFRNLSLASGITFTPGTFYNSPNMAQEHVAGFGSSYDYPVGYPTWFPTYGAR